MSAVFVHEEVEEEDNQSAEEEEEEDQYEPQNGGNKNGSSGTTAGQGESNRLRRARKKRIRSGNRGSAKYGRRVSSTSSVGSGYGWGQRNATKAHSAGPLGRPQPAPGGHITVHAQNKKPSQDRRDGGTNMTYGNTSFKSFSNSPGVQSKKTELVEIVEVDPDTTKTMTNGLGIGTTFQNGGCDSGVFFNELKGEESESQGGRVLTNELTVDSTANNSHMLSASKKKALARNRLSVNNFHNRSAGSLHRSKAQMVTDNARSLLQKNSDTVTNTGETKLDKANGVSKPTQLKNSTKHHTNGNGYMSKLSSASTSHINSTHIGNPARISSAPAGRQNQQAPQSVPAGVEKPRIGNSRVGSASAAQGSPSKQHQRGYRLFGKTEETPYQREITASHLQRLSQTRDRFSTITPGVQLRYDSAPPRTKPPPSKNSEPAVTFDPSATPNSTLTSTPTFVNGAPTPAANGMVFKRQYANPRILSLSYIGLQNPRNKTSNFAFMKTDTGIVSTDTVNGTDPSSDEQETLSLKIAQLKRDNAPVKPILKYPEEPKKPARVSSSKSVRFHLPEPEATANPVKEMRYLRLF